MNFEKPSTYHIKYNEKYLLSNDDVKDIKCRNNTDESKDENIKKIKELEIILRTGKSIFIKVKKEDMTSIIMDVEDAMRYDIDRLYINGIDKNIMVLSKRVEAIIY